jgi:hypothetical protein
MNENLKIALLVALFAFLGFRMYQKYFKKGGGKPDSAQKPGSSFTNPSKDDEYEPYSKK